MRRRVVTRAAKAVDALDRGVPANADALRQAAFYADPETYFDYFTGLLGARRGSGSPATSRRRTPCCPRRGWPASGRASPAAACARCRCS